MSASLMGEFDYRSSNDEDYLDREKRDEKALSIIKARLAFYNKYAKVLDPQAKIVNVQNIGISLTEGSIVKWILRNNKEIDKIREHLILNGTKSQRKALTEKINTLAEGR